MRNDDKPLVALHNRQHVPFSLTFWKVKNLKQEKLNLGAYILGIAINDSLLTDKSISGEIWRNYYYQWKHLWIFETKYHT